MKIVNAHNNNNNVMLLFYQRKKKYPSQQLEIRNKESCSVARYGITGPQRCNSTLKLKLWFHFKIECYEKKLVTIELDTYISWTPCKTNFLTFWLNCTELFIRRRVKFRFYNFVDQQQRKPETYIVNIADIS